MCTGIRMTATNGDIVYARTLEFDTPLPAYLGYVPRGQSFVGTTATGDDGLKWNNKYAYAGCLGTINLGGVNIDGGADVMNEHGVVSGCFNLPGYTEFPAVTDDNRSHAIASWQVPEYIVGNYASTAEARAGIQNGDFIVVATPFPFPGKPAQFPQHVRVGDPTGETIVVEWNSADQPPIINESASGIITNSPLYTWHLANMEQFEHLSPYNPSGPFHEGTQDYKQTMGDGYVGMPGGSSAPDRFIRASLYARDSYPGPDGESTVWAARHVMNCFDLPPGILRNVDADTNVESSEYALWTGVADTKNLVYYFRSHTDNGIYEIDLKAMDPEGTTTLSNKSPAETAYRTITAFPS
jgi:choloylglycine hydrolase